jgi:hypothetical protein
LRVVPIVKYFRDKNRKKKGDRKGYETKSPKNVDDQKTIEILNKYLGDTAFHRRPLLIDNDDPWLTRKIVVSMMVELTTSTNEEFNYVCCTVSPANIWKIIKLACNDDEECLAKMKQRLVFVDAYTETFGFGDEILTTRIEEMRTEDHISIVSCSSAAGVHKGTTDAFKILKDNAKKDLKGGRGACTVIYDTISALAISETEQEISEFIINLTAAEQTYDMLSLFIEPDLESRESLSILSMRACCGKPIVIGGQHEAV